MGGPYIIKVNLTSATKHVFSASSESFSLATCVFSPVSCKLQHFLSLAAIATWFAETMARDGGVFCGLKQSPQCAKCFQNVQKVHVLKKSALRKQVREGENK